MERAEDYQFFNNRGFGQSLGINGKSCLIVVDMMNGFTNENHPMGADLSEQISKVNKFIQFSRENDITVLFTVIAYENKDLSDKGIWFQKMRGLDQLIEDTDDVQLDDRLEYKSSDSILKKKYASSFFGTDLSSRLTANNIENVIVTGTTTSGCVRATVVDAIQLGFRPIVLSDCCGDRSLMSHDQSIFDMEQKYADVYTSEEYMELLNKKSEV